MDEMFVETLTLRLRKSGRERERERERGNARAREVGRGGKEGRVRAERG